MLTDSVETTTSAPTRPQAPRHPHTRFELLGEVPHPAVTHPDCPDGVTFALYQVHKDNLAIRRVTKKVTGAARCSTTGIWVPAIAWTREMERAFKSLAKDIPKQPAGRTFLPRFYVTLAVALTLVAAIVGTATYFLWDELSGAPNAYQQSVARIAEVSAAPAVGDLLLSTVPGGDGLTYLWHVIEDVTDDAVTVRAYATPTTTSAFESEPDDLDPSQFTGDVLEVDRSAFLNESFLGPSEDGVLVMNAFPNE